MNVVRAPWSTWSFLLYAGALIVLFGAAQLLGVIEGDHSAGAFAGWSVLFFLVAAACAAQLRVASRPVAAGLFAFVAVGLFTAMVGAFLNWFGWLHFGGGPFRGFHWGLIAVEVALVLASLAALRIFRFPLIVFALAAGTWYLVSDVVSSGGAWTAVVTLVVGIVLLGVGLRLDVGASRPYGFWTHVTAGATVGGALLYFWHSSDLDWALVIVASLVYIALGATTGRSTYAVFGAVGLFLATGYFAAGEPFFGLGFFFLPLRDETASWAGPLGYACLGFFLALLGLLVAGRRREGDLTAPP